MRGRVSAAQQALDDYIREGRLSANRSQPIGAGSYGVVYQSDVPGNVIKQATQWGQDLEREANLQAVAADMGIAPQVRGLEQFIGSVGDRIEMADVRPNYQTVVGEGDQFGMPGVGIPVDPTVNIRTAQQLGQLALKGIQLGDRRAANVMQHKMTGRPLQLDFGIAKQVEGEDQVMALMEATHDGLTAAGLDDVGRIYRATVMDHVVGGEVDAAMDIAKQGFSRLQKIKQPILQRSIEANDAPGRDQRVAAMSKLQALEEASRKEQAKDDLIDGMLEELEDKVAASDPVLARILAY